MQKFITAIVALLATAEAVKVKDGVDKDRLGAIMGSGPINNDYHLVTAAGQESGAFQEWAANNNRSYATSSEMAERLQNFIANNRAIREHNQAAEASGVAHPAMFNHNEMSDTTKEERDRMHGLGHLMESVELAQARVEAKTQAKAKAKTRAKSKVRSTVKSEGNTAGTHDWTWATLPVEQQGACGSCWAFAGNTVLEATEFVGRRNSDPNAVREDLSFQMPVDCVENCYGCSGGWVDRFNKWMVDNGVQSRESYPYVANDQNCQSSASDRKMGFAVSEATIWSVDDAVEAMARGPLGAYFAVGDGFSWYSSGLIRTGDGNCLPVGYITNHAMAVVGIDLVGEGSVTTSEVDILHARWMDATGCDESAGEFEWNDYPDFCLWWGTEEQDEIVGEGAFWKIQNSWGPYWGHEGFAYFAMEDEVDYGNCGIHDEGMFIIGTASNPIVS